MNHPWSDRAGALAYEFKRRIAWRFWSTRAEKRQRLRGDTRLGYLMLGHGMTYSGSARYPLEDGFSDVAEWVYAGSDEVGFDVKAFATGSLAEPINHGDIHRQLCFVYRDNLVHFFWFLRWLANEGIDPVAYLVGKGRLLPTYHSSGLYATLYVSGCASWSDADRLATSAACKKILYDVECEHVGQDIAELRALIPEEADPVTREAVRILVRTTRKLYRHIPRAAGAIERVFEQTSGDVSLEDREMLGLVLKGRLACLSGFGPRPYGREDVERLLGYCGERGIHVELSVINGPDLHVIGGSALNIARAEIVAKRGLAGRVPFLVSKVLVDSAPHTSRHREVVRRYESVVDRFLAEGRLREPAIPFVSRHGRIVSTVEDVRHEVLHLLDEVYDFQEMCRTAIRHGMRWVVMGLSGEQSAGRRVVRANLMDAAMSHGAGDFLLASTDVETARSRQEREALTAALSLDARAMGLGAMGSGMFVRSLEGQRAAWESALEVCRMRHEFEREPSHPVTVS